MSAMNEPFGVSVTLKWFKQIFTDQFRLVEGLLAREFKEQIQKETGVPVERQKLLCKQCWKGSLKDHVIFSKETLPRGPVTVTLIGSAEKLPEPPKEKTKFIEDLTTDELLAQEEAEKATALDNSEGMIMALQLPPHFRDDNKTEMYQYNRLVTGLPQREIENMLRSRRTTSGSTLQQQEQNNQDNQLLGKVVMTLGLELRRAYVNDLAVLSDGTLASGLDDGHVQLWRHGALVQDVIHEGIQEGGVDCVVSFEPNRNDIAFATGGRGCVRLWDAEGNCIRSMPSPAGTSPSSLVAMHLRDNALCLAASFRITRQSDPSQFRLVPQDEAGRQRRAHAEAQEAAIQESLSRVSKCVQVWYSKGGSELRSIILEPDDIVGSAPATDLAALHGPAEQDGWTLVCGDAAGGLRAWQVQCNNDGDARGRLVKLFQLRPHESVQVASVVCLESLANGLLAISTEGSVGQELTQISGSNLIQIPLVRAVFLFDVSNGCITKVLNGHKDTVQCMCTLPNGSLVTGGGKYDATTKVWDKALLMGNNEKEDHNHANFRVVEEASEELKEVGFVLAVAVLPGDKPDSHYFALAAARYNTVKICI